ncbi:O-antigen ligase family protein [Actinomycetospora aeridis]|uniref:O-antigen ligase family protein n=1 Tax=Actinomycetospora aeridis TaxID=3129231 RepID=A0ABU8N7U8_9PSEU
MTQLQDRPVDEGTAAPPEAEPPRTPWALGARSAALPLAVAALALGAAALTGQPLAALVVAAAVVLVPFLVRRPRLVLVLLVVVQVGNLSAAADRYGVPDTYFALVALGAVCVLRECWHSRRLPAWSSVLLFGAIYVALRFASVRVALDVDAASGTMVDLAGDLVLIALLLALCHRWRGELSMAASAVVTATVLCVLELLRQFVVGNEVTFFGILRPATIQDVGLIFPRHTGPLEDFNFWGRVLVLILPFALSLFADRSFGRRRWLWMGSTVVLFGGIYLTGSRGTLLAAGFVVVVWLALAGARYRRLLIWLPFILAGILLIPGIGTRLASIGDVATTSSGAADESLTGRLGALRAGLSMITDHPLTGVGAGNFIPAFPAVARANGIDSLVLAPHNMYLQIAAESGIPALLAWLAFFGAAVLAAVRARYLLGGVRTPSGILPPEAMLATAAIASLGGWAVAGIVLHADNLRILAIPIVIAASLDMAARRSVAPRLGGARSWQPGMLWELAVREREPRRQWHWVLPAAVGVVVAVAVGLSPLVVIHRWSTTATVEIVADPSHGPLDDYAVEVLNRAPLSATYLAVLSDPATVRAAGDAAGLPPDEVRTAAVTAATTDDPQQLTVTVNAATPEVSRALADGAVPAATDHFATMRPLYVLVPRGADEPVETTTFRPLGLGIALIAATLAVPITATLAAAARARFGDQLARRTRRSRRSAVEEMTENDDGASTRMPTR